ncbi:hypothetical protein C2G38_2252945 [Gigaspora rosea]|uniref:Uncharacterized protein n=1 Tax=Gigaspora rosea TaxID=44941 RepID=A0A397UBA3_9GLOM|nr:hypothetical protein C2G38_2252945 [Gigaspora rosea]
MLNKIIEETKNFISDDERIKSTVADLGINFEHIYISMNEIKEFLGTGNIFDFESNAYPRDPEHINRASKLINKLIIIYFYTKAWTSPDIRKCLELMSDKSEDYDDVINLICKEKNLKNAESLALILQIDEFQNANYWTVILLRIISSFLLKGTLIIAICTGTAPSQIVELGDDQSYKISASQYKTINLYLSPLDFEDSIQLFDRFIEHFSNESNFNDSSKIYRSIVNSIREIPSIIEIASRIILSMKKANLDAFENFESANVFWRFLRDAIKAKYTEVDWFKCLQSEENILKLLFYIHIQKPVKKDEKLDSSTTIQDFETSGLIFLEQFDNRFIPRAPLVLVSILVDYLKLYDIFNENLLKPFELLTEETFPQFILHMHHVTYSLAFRTGSSYITIHDIYGGCARGSNRVLDCDIDVRQQIEYYVRASLIPKTENSFSKPGLSDRSKLPVIVLNKNGFKEIDVTSEKYLVLIARRTKSADAITPHADEQYRIWAASSRQFDRKNWC